MIKEEKRNILTGVLGTIAFHLLLLVVFLSFKIGEVKTKHEELMSVELVEEEYKSIEEIIEENKLVQEKITPLSQQAISNIVSNVADKVNEEINTDKYIEEVMKELGMEEINPHFDNSLPEEPAVNKDDKKKKEVKTNFGQTRITYHVPPNRKASYIDRPIYRCQGGGTVIVSIAVDPQGQVLQADVQSSTTSEDCVLEMAIVSARNFRFERDPAADKRVNGTITYMFVAQ
jgi:hypothetical protein